MQLQIDFDPIVLPHLYTISNTTYYRSGPILYWMFIMFISRLRYNYYTSIISIYQVCCLYSYFSRFFFYCTVRKFFILCTIFLAYLRKNCTFLPSKYEKKSSLGCRKSIIPKTPKEHRKRPLRAPKRSHILQDGFLIGSDGFLQHVSNAKQGFAKQITARAT